MWYAFICKDTAGSLEKRRQASEEHFARLTTLQQNGKLLVAGPFPATDCLDPGDAGFTGSLIVAEFDSLEDARAWADAEPFLTVGAYEKIEVKPFNPVLR